MSVDYWVGWLRSLDALAGLPIIVIGLGLMLGGWRVGRVCVVLTLAAFGAAAGLHFADGTGPRLVLAAAGAVLLGTFGVTSKTNAPTVLGGLLGAGVLGQFLTPWGLPGWALALALGLGFLCVAALCACNQRNMIILITALEGAGLLLSGLVPVLARWPYLFGFFESTHRASWVFFPFVILVPTAVGYFLQMADAKKHVA